MGQVERKKVFFSQYSQYILVNGKWKTEKTKIPTSRLAFLGVTRRTGNTFLLKVGLSAVSWVWPTYSYLSTLRFWCSIVAMADIFLPLDLTVLVQYRRYGGHILTSRPYGFGAVSSLWRTYSYLSTLRFWCSIVAMADIFLPLDLTVLVQYRRYGRHNLVGEVPQVFLLLARYSLPP